MRGKRSRMMAGIGLFSGAAVFAGSGAEVVGACSQTVSSNGPNDTGQTTCDAGDLCLDANWPKDYVAYSFPNGYIQYYSSYCFTNNFGDLNDRISTFSTKWSVSVTTFQNANFNYMDPGGKRCFAANGATDIRLSQYGWTTGGPAGNNMGDSISSHKSFGASC
jgi:hypothetical protein